MFSGALIPNRCIMTYCYTKATETSRSDGRSSRLLRAVGGPAGVHRDIPLRPTVLVTRLLVVMTTLHNLHKQHCLGVFPELRTATVLTLYLSACPLSRMELFPLGAL